MNRFNIIDTDRQTQTESIVWTPRLLDLCSVISLEIVLELQSHLLTIHAQTCEYSRGDSLKLIRLIALPMKLKYSMC